jgi:hypothetical protein
MPFAARWDAADGGAIGQGDILHAGYSLVGGWIRALLGWGIRSVRGRTARFDHLDHTPRQERRLDVRAQPVVCQADASSSALVVEGGARELRKGRLPDEILAESRESEERPAS